VAPGVIRHRPRSSPAGKGSGRISPVAVGGQAGQNGGSVAADPLVRQRRQPPSCASAHPYIRHAV